LVAKLNRMKQKGDKISLFSLTSSFPDKII
jgi:hypothetical protein